MLILKSGVVYFVVVFGAGFLLGTIRTLLVAPHLGERSAELLEAPVMFVVTILAARWIILRFRVPALISSRLGMGVLALALLLLAEIGFTVWLRGLSPAQYFATRDPISGGVYCALLLIFSVMPLLVARK